MGVFNLLNRVGNQVFLRVIELALGFMQLIWNYTNLCSSY